MGTARELAERALRSIEQGDWDGLHSLAADDIEFVTPFGPVSGPDGVVEFMSMWRRAFPDIRFVIDAAVETDDVAALEGRMLGTQDGPLSSPQGEIPATGKPVESPSCMVFRARDGKIASFHGYADTLTIMAQLGLAPAPEPEPAQA